MSWTLSALNSIPGINNLMQNAYFRQSVNDISGYRRPKLPGAKGGNSGIKGGKGKGGKNKRNQRMGKMRRQKHKGKK